MNQMIKKLLFVAVIAIPILLLLVLAPTATFALSSNETNTTNQTNSLLKAILAQQKLQIELQQDNVQVLAIKLDIIKAELEKLQQELQPPLSTPPTPPPPPPVFLQPPFNATGSSCQPHNDNGVLIYPCPQIPTFPTLQPPLSIIPPSTAIPLPPTLAPPFPPIPPVTDCIPTEYGVFCPTN